MNKAKWKIIEEFILNDKRFDSDDFEEYLEVVNREQEEELMWHN